MKTEEPNQLTKEQAAFLLGLLANMQITGKPGEVRQTLEMVESIQDKLKAYV